MPIAVRKPKGKEQLRHIWKGKSLCQQCGAHAQAVRRYWDVHRIAIPCKPEAAR